MQDRLPFQRAIEISRLEGEVNGGGARSTREGLAGIASEARTVGQ